MTQNITKIFSKIRKQSRSINRDENGNMLVTAGVLMPLIVLFCAVAIEYSMAISLNQRVQNTADAALMAAAIEVKKSGK